MRRLPPFAIFALIGILNTVADIVLYVSLRQLGLPLLLANICSTTTALMLSFLLNKRYTFNSALSTGQAVIPFLLVTLAGLWILQPIAIHSFGLVIAMPAVSQALADANLGNSATRDTICKLAATPVTMIWNFVLYKYVVFKDKQSNRI